MIIIILQKSEYHIIRIIKPQNIYFRKYIIKVSPKNVCIVMIYNVNNLPAECEGYRGKYQTEVLVYLASDSEVNNAARARFDIFPYSPNSRSQ